MRYLPTLILACLPLAALTGWSIWRAGTGDAPTANKESQPDTAEIAKRASSAAVEVKLQQPLVRELVERDLLDASETELPDSADAKLKQAWQGSQQARRLMSKYAHVGATNVSASAAPSVRRREAEAALARLRGFVESEKPNNVGVVAGADELFAMLERREKDLEKEIQTYREQDQINEAVAAVKGDLDQGRYDACLKRLDSEPLTQIADQALSDQLQLLRKRVEYRRVWDELDQTGTSTGDRDLYNKMQAFLRKYPDPPSPAERDLQAQLERRRDRLKSEISVHVLDEARDLDTLLTEAAQIVANNHIEETIKQQARHQVTQWLQTHLPKIEEPASLLGKQEAVTKSGQRKIGIFFLPPGVDNYRFWTDRKNRDKLRQGEEQISRSTLEQPPATPQYVTWAESFNLEVSGLLRSSASQADWQKFADDCDTWQQQLAVYREQWGVEDEPDRSCREWSFRDAGLTARNVLRNWEAYRAIVAPSQ